MRTAVIIAQMLAAIAGLLVLMAAVFYGVGWAVMFAMRFVPLIGKRHRHERWDELTHPKRR